MKLSPLQLEKYFLADLTFRANPEHEPSQPVQFQEEDWEVQFRVQSLSAEERRWQVAITVKLHPRSEANSPYTFSLSLMGMIWAAPQLSSERLEPLVRTNGPSMLYGVAREMVRDLTARGPYPALSLPSVSFLNAETAPSVQSADPPSGKVDAPRC
jgi:preprotein translocase subunit SecB